MFRIILVGFLPTDNGRSCVHHPYGCGNFWVLEREPYHGVGMQIRLRLVDGSHLAGYIVEADGSDGCRVCFAAREYAVGVVESGLMVVFSKSRRWFSLIMRILASELCSIVTADMQSLIYLHRDQIGLHATIQKGFQ